MWRGAIEDHRWMRRHLVGRNNLYWKSIEWLTFVAHRKFSRHCRQSTERTRKRETVNRKHEQNPLFTSLSAIFVFFLSDTMHCQLQHKRYTETNAADRTGHHRTTDGIHSSSDKSLFQDRRERKKKQEFCREAGGLENRRTMFWVCHADDSTQKRIIIFKDEIKKCHSYHNDCSLCQCNSRSPCNSYQFDWMRLAFHVHRSFSTITNNILCVLLFFFLAALYFCVLLVLFIYFNFSFISIDFVVVVVCWLDSSFFFGAKEENEKFSSRRLSNTKQTANSTPESDSISTAKMQEEECQAANRTMPKTSLIRKTPDRIRRRKGNEQPK